tara:strand:+ start:865 stop:1065 length:201 start_codon:yes stop_codon:yes gene_type:complete
MELSGCGINRNPKASWRDALGLLPLDIYLSLYAHMISAVGSVSGMGVVEPYHVYEYFEELPLLWRW